MMDQEYWTKRFEQLEQAAHRDAMEIMGDVDRFYREATRELDGDISRWYQRFANNNGIVDMAEARRLLNSTELKEFKWTVDDYIKHGQENGITADWSRQLENASARWHISRYEALKVQLQNTVEVLYGNQLDAMDELARKTFLETYGHTAFEIQKGLGVGWDVAGLNRGAIEKAVQKPWSLDGRNFSERIWGNREKLINELHQQLTQNLMRGGNVNDVIAHIEKTMGVSHSNAKRLVLTENAYIHSVAQEESYKKLGVKAVVFIATLDERTSQECRDMDGTVIDMKDYQPGVNIPPLHPYCRSCTAPHFADMVGLGERVATNPDTGQQYFIPRSTTYREWEKAFMQDPVTGESGSKDGLTIATAEDIAKVMEPIPKVESIISQDCKDHGVERKEITRLDHELTVDEIVDRIAGGDKTQGSCASVALAYVGNRAGYDVIDFRGEPSRYIISSNYKNLVKLPNLKVLVEKDGNDIKAVNRLFARMEPNKEYILWTGKHASVVREVNGVKEYLELQSGSKNGYKPFTPMTLRYRFGCQKSHTTYGMQYKTSNYLIDADSLAASDQLPEILTYINTDPDKQKKGRSGNVK